MSARSRLALLALCSTAFVACADHAPTATQTSASGITGVATESPTCPVEIPGNPCPARHAAGIVILVENPGGDEILRFTTSSDGSFRVPLAPGPYTLTTGRPTNAPTLRPQALTVTANSYVTVNLDLDTGIR